MSRLLVPQKMDEIRIHNSEDHLIIYLDRNKKDFFCDVQGDEIRDPNFSTLRDRIQALAKTLVNFDWKPAIEVRTGMAVFHRTERASYASVNIEIDRYYVAKKPEVNQWLKCFWEVPPEQRGVRRDLMFWRKMSVTEFTEPINSDDKSFHYFPYTEPLWVALVDMVRRLNDVSTELDKFLSKRDTAALIEKQGVEIMRLMLPGSKAE